MPLVENLVVPENSRNIIDALGQDSLLDELINSFPEEGIHMHNGSFELTVEQKGWLDGITTQLFKIEENDAVNMFGLTESALGTLGIRLISNSGVRSWVTNREIPERSTIAKELRELVARVGLYKNPGTIDVLDWFDRGVENGVVVIPIEEEVVRLRYIGSPSPADALNSLYIYAKEEYGYSMYENIAASKSQKRIRVILEDYSELNPTLIDDFNPDALTIMNLNQPPTEKVSHRVSNVSYVAVGLQSVIDMQKFVLDFGEGDLVQILPDSTIGLTHQEIVGHNLYSKRSGKTKRLQGAYNYLLQQLGR